MDKTDSFICDHYNRYCSVECPQCKGMFPCHVCHDNVATDHKLNIHDVKNVMCNSCLTLQSSSEKCVFCGHEFGKYYCSFCNLFDDNDKGYFHCFECGICRQGSQENYFHCPKCDTCMTNDMKNSHKCVANSSKSDCPICQEFLHTSHQYFEVLNCGHSIHSHCYQNMLQRGDAKCPLCRDSTIPIN